MGGDRTFTVTEIYLKSKCSSIEIPILANPHRGGQGIWEPSEVTLLLLKLFELRPFAQQEWKVLCYKGHTPDSFTLTVSGENERELPGFSTWKQTPVCSVTDLWPVVIF